MSYLKGKLGELVGVAGLLAMLGAGLLVAFQGYAWLKTGEWPSLPLGAAILMVWHFTPTSEWGGVQKLINLTLDLPTSAALFFGGVGVMMLGMKWQMEA